MALRMTNGARAASGPDGQVRPALLAAVLTLVLGIVLGTVATARAAEPDMDAVNAQALQTLAAKGLKLKQVSVGDSYSAAVTTDGDLWTWGDNLSGSLGYYTEGVYPGGRHPNPDGTVTTLEFNGLNYNATPKKVEGLPPVATFVPGDQKGGAITVDGELWTWGSNGSGDLGYETPNNFSFFPHKAEGLSSVKDASLVGPCSAAVTEDGSLWVWGSNLNGEFGHEPTAGIEQTMTPTKVTGIPAMKSVRLGGMHVVALAQDGTVWAWGSNQYGQLGQDKTTTYSNSTPTKVPGLPAAASIVATMDSSAIVTEDGDVWQWGADCGLLQNQWGSTDVPQKASGLPKVKSLAISQFSWYSALVDEDGGLWTCGASGYDGPDSNFCHLGYDTTETYCPLRKVEGVPAAETVSLGQHHGAILGADGSAWLWGANYDGQLGDGNRTNDGWTNRATPAEVVIGAVDLEPSSVTFSPSSLKLVEGQAATTVAVGGTGDGALSVKSVSDASVASATLSGTTLTVTPLKAGTCVVTVARAATDRFEATEGTITVTVTEAAKTVTIWRVYNEWTGEHIFTPDRSEYVGLGNSGWKQEGIAWTAPATSDTPVYRLYNEWSGDHHYTKDYSEYQAMGRNGWKQENIAFYSAGEDQLPIYRLFNPFVEVGTHHYTTGWTEYDSMGKAGWVKEGIAFYGLK